MELAEKTEERATKAEELATGQQNRRAVPRYGVDEDARLLLVKHGSTLACRIVDLCLSGCRLRTKERFPAGSMVRVEVNFKVRGLAFRFNGLTQWTDGRHLVGIRFADVSSRRKEELAVALSEVEAENLAKAAKQAAEKAAAEEQAVAKWVAEEEAAVKRVAEEKAAALKAVNSSVAPPVAVQAGQQAPGPSPVKAAARTSTAQNPPWQQFFSIPPRAAGPVIKAVSGPLTDSAPADRRPPERPLARPLLATPQPPAPQEAPTQPAAPPPPKLSKRERREQTREEVDTSAVIHLVNVASRLQGRILDLSVGGCRIRTDDRFPVGIYTRVETEFRLEGLPFRLGGVIQAIHDRQHVGIRFLDMSSRKRGQVEQLIEEIREMREEQGVGNRE